MLDLIVVGAGPAGLSAGLVAHGNGLAVRVLEAEPQGGGQLLWADHPIGDLLGQPSATGPEAARRLIAHAEAAGAPIERGHRVEAVLLEGERFRVVGPVDHLARAVLLASGTRPRALGFPGEDLRARQPPAAWVGRRVVVIGGGDEAATTARDLAVHGVDVSLVMRGDPRARPQFWRAVEALPRIEVIRRDHVVAVRDGRVQLASGQVREAVHVLTRIGVEVVSPRVVPAPAREPDGRFVVDGDHQTTVPRLFAGGDATVTGPSRYAAVAIAHGARVARRVEELLGSG